MSSASEMTVRLLTAEEGRLLIAEAPAGARMSKAKVLKIVVVSVLATLLLAAAARSMARYYDGAELCGFFGRDNFLMICVATHLISICLLARCAATAPTLAARCNYANSTVASSVHLAANLYFALVVGPKKLQDAA